jgi:hypothetical protein
MDSEKLSTERRWRNAIVLFLGIFVACAIIAWVLAGVLPSNLQWAGIEVPIVIATLGSLAGLTGCLCAIRLVQLRTS